MTMLIVNCAQIGPTKVEVFETGGDWVNVIRLTEHDIEVMDRQAKKTRWRITKFGRRTAPR